MMTLLYRYKNGCQSSIRPVLMVLWLMLTAVLTACSGSSDEPQRLPQGPTVLEIYVYSPGQAVPTRTDMGQVDADPEAENAINTLQIWVFKHSDDHPLVSYFKTKSLNSGSNKLELSIPDDFADSPSNVDVYVLANVTPNSCGLTLDETTPSSSLENVVLAGNYFGLSETPVTEVPFEGLPMSGVLRNQTVSGSTPVLYLGTSSSDLAKVELKRVVSKVRFVFSCSNDFNTLKINSVEFDADMIPNQEYLFLNADNPTCRINTLQGYNNAANISLFSLGETAHCDDPAYYAWDRMMRDEKNKNPDITNQQLADKYEALIRDGLSVHEGEDSPRLTERRVYLRESDKKLSGTIKYQVKEDADGNFSDEISASFVMDEAGDFSRNHTWIVYAYLAWAKMNIVAVYIDDWKPTAAGEYTVYNW